MRLADTNIREYKMTTNTIAAYGIKANRAATSLFGAAERWTKANGEIITGSREEMQARANELNAKSVPNTWYSVAEID